MRLTLPSLHNSALLAVGVVATFVNSNPGGLKEATWKVKNVKFEQIKNKLEDIESSFAGVLGIICAWEKIKRQFLHICSKKKYDIFHTNIFLVALYDLS